MHPLLHKIRQRKMVQWGLAYLAGAWVLLQVLSLIGDHFAWPDEAMRALTIVLGVGFLAALVLAWYHGERGDQRAGTIELLMLAALLVIAGTSVAFVGDRGRAQPAGAPSTPLAAEPGSIAVLPFVNTSSDAENQYFSDGLTEELINALAKVEGLRVAARTSVFAYQDRQTDVREIGRGLAVSAVLEGSVRKAEDRLKVTAQLIDVATGYQLWSESYERELSDVFEIQNEIAQAIVVALRGKLPGIGAELVHAGTADPEAYTLYLKGRYYWNNRGVGHADFQRLACEHYERAVERDATFAAAWGGMADCYYLSYGGVAGSMQRARTAARKALELDPTLSGPHSALAQTYVNDGAWDRAEREHRAAITLNPNDPWAFQRYALMLTWMGRHDESLRALRQAEKIDPSSLIVHRDIAGVLTNARRYDEALEASRRARELNPGFAGVFVEIYVAKGMYDEAIGELQRPGPASDYALQAWAYAAAGRMDDARRALGELERRAAAGGDVRPIALAQAHMAIGNTDRAFHFLERQLEELPFTFAHWQIRPYWDPLRSDPRWGRLLERVGLDPRTR